MKPGHLKRCHYKGFHRYKRTFEDVISITFPYLLWLIKITKMLSSLSFFFYCFITFLFVKIKFNLYRLKVKDMLDLSKKKV